jgi:hypothetical protein
MFGPGASGNAQSRAAVRSVSGSSVGREGRFDADAHPTIQDAGCIGVAVEGGISLVDELNTAGVCDHGAQAGLRERPGDKRVAAEVLLASAEYGLPTIAGQELGDAVRVHQPEPATTGRGSSVSYSRSSYLQCTKIALAREDAGAGACLGTPAEGAPRVARARPSPSGSRKATFRDACPTTLLKTDPAREK